MAEFSVLFCGRGNQEKRYDAGAFIGYSRWYPNACYVSREIM